MSDIKELYPKYFQKSRVFLYPLLGIKKGVSITPIQTHIEWEGKIKKEDRRLMCLYHTRDDTEYKEFERRQLKGNFLFEKLVTYEDDGPKGLYIFNLTAYSKDWDCFLRGKYSLFSLETKRKIKDFFKGAETSAVYADSFLNPRNYYSIYSELLGVSTAALKEVVELTSPPDMEMETIKLDETTKITAL